MGPSIQENALLSKELLNALFFPRIWWVFGDEEITTETAAQDIHA